MLTTVPGVTQVEVQGGAVEEYHVVADPAKLAAYGLTLDDVAAALSRRPTSSPPSGGWRTATSWTLVVADTQFKRADIGR